MAGDGVKVVDEFHVKQLVGDDLEVVAFSEAPVVVHPHIKSIGLKIQTKVKPVSHVSCI